MLNVTRIMAGNDVIDFLMQVKDFLAVILFTQFVQFVYKREPTIISYLVSMKSDT